LIIQRFPCTYGDLTAKAAPFYMLYKQIYGEKKCVLLMNNEIVFISFLQCKELLRNSTRSKQGDNTQKGKQGTKEALTQVVGSALANSAQIFCIGSE